MNLHDLDILFIDFVAIYLIDFSIWLEMNFMRMVDYFIDVSEAFGLGAYYQARVI